MRVCLDVFALTHLPNTGLYTYAYGVVKGLLTAYPHPQYHLISNNMGIKIEFEKEKVLSVNYLDVNRKGNDFKLIYDFLKSKKIKLYHSLNNGFSVPTEKACKYVITIQDVLPLVNKELVDVRYKKKYMDLVPAAIKKSDKVIAVSVYVKEQLMKNLGVREEDIEVIYPVVSKDFKPIWAMHYKNFLLKQYSLTSDYILSVGAIDPRKNLKLVILTFEELFKIYSSLKLVIIGEVGGKRHKHYLELKSLIEKLGIGSNVIFLGSINYNELPYFYNAASCYVNLSEFEGYPTSAVEAMKCQTPVICKDSSPFKEVLGEYAIYTSSDEPSELAKKISKVINDDNLRYLSFSKKEELIDNQDSVRKLIRVYENLLYP